MRYLIIVTLVWAFSFSFIGEVLAGKVDSYFAILIRVLLASLVFIPFTKFKDVPNKLRLGIMSIGVVQIGLMYICYYNSFLFLSVPEVVLFTIFTPFYVTLIYDVLKKRFRKLYLISAAIAVAGAFVIKYNQINSDFLVGFLLIQGANICFAIGQTGYKRLLEIYPNTKQSEVFGYFHFGACIIAFIAFICFGNFDKISPNFNQWLVLLWLGIIASGVGYFMWNKGATQVDSGVLAIMNNALVPAGLIANLLLWQKQVELISFCIGSILIFGSLWVHGYILKYYNKKEGKLQYS